MNRNIACIGADYIGGPMMAVITQRNPDSVLICGSTGARWQKAVDYREGVIKMNEMQQRRIFDRIVKVFFGTLVSKRVALFGFAFKTNTGDIRETPALTVANLLAEEYAEIVVTDPKPLRNAAKDLAHFDSVTLEPAPYKAAESCDKAYVGRFWQF